MRDDSPLTGFLLLLSPCTRPGRQPHTCEFGWPTKRHTVAFLKIDEFFIQTSCDHCDGSASLKECMTGLMISTLLFNFFSNSSADFSIVFSALCTSSRIFLPENDRGCSDRKTSEHSYTNRTPPSSLVV